MFNRDGILCFAYFQGQDCLCEAYARDDSAWLGSGQLEAVLDANSFGKEWHSRATGKEDEWYKDDNSAHATTIKGPPPDWLRFVVFDVPRFSDLIEAENQAKKSAQKAQVGFLNSPVADEPRDRTPKSVSQADAKSIAESQKRAVANHPTLAVAGSPFNKAFIARLKTWRTAHDPRLDRSDWPEILADDCAVKP